MSALFTPLKLGNTMIPNRIGMSALTRNRSTTTVPNELMLKYYVQRAKGGAGLIVSEGILISRQGSEWQQAPGIWNQAQIDGLVFPPRFGAEKLIYFFHSSFGTDASHTLMPPNKLPLEWQPVYAPSAISARGGKFRFLTGHPGYVTPTEIADPTTLIAQFKQAAINAKEAGFDGVELHGANGYLVHQFLDSTSNHRTDKWGGSSENRARFALETLRALIEVWGPDVALKISPTGGYNDMGMPLQDTIDTFGHLLREADKLGLSYVTLVRYSTHTDVEFEGKLRATQHDVLSTFAPLLTSTPVFVNSGVTPAEAEALVRSGKAAGVFMGINWISHPDLVRRLKAGQALDNVLDFVRIYGSDAEGVDLTVGYVDYPEATY
ncbi:Artemisinic aldehyde Delta(11(13)) reductase [Mycena sanguinolenta]|uniref:Artemisinic aldehyde Delta(11(13)) reductase n=1 Tax=Mycena sanguinolenta TaxID=230812 RepID=A0A8H6YQ00_9AGAR|nr:Artemisinic aldehyde Delta(11(13)) reductase [Mycena sanguinolenta]